MGFPSKEDIPYLAGPYYDQLYSSGENCTKYYNRLFDLFPLLSETALDLLSSLLEYDPKKRITVTEALNHPFFSVSQPKVPVKMSNKTRRTEQHDSPIKQQKIETKLKKEVESSQYKASDDFGATIIYRHSHKNRPQMDEESASELLQESLDMIPLLNPHLASMDYMSEREHQRQNSITRSSSVKSAELFEVSLPSTMTTETQTSIYEVTKEDIEEPLQESQQDISNSLLEVLISVDRYFCSMSFCTYYCRAKHLNVSRNSGFDLLKFTYNMGETDDEEEMVETDAERVATNIVFDHGANVMISLEYFHNRCTSGPPLKIQLWGVDS